MTNAAYTEFTIVSAECGSCGEPTEYAMKPGRTLLQHCPACMRSLDLTMDRQGKIIHSAGFVTRVARTELRPRGASGPVRSAPKGAVVTARTTTKTRTTNRTTRGAEGTDVQRPDKGRGWRASRISPRPLADSQQRGRIMPNYKTTAIIVTKASQRIQVNQRVDGETGGEQVHLVIGQGFGAAPLTAEEAVSLAHALEQAAGL